ncbi:MAG: hypothetical protein ACRDSF_00485 [Pseudonocardiaceae bacterium]
MTTEQQRYQLTLPWKSPPLTGNQRLHWATRARLTAEIRSTVGWLARSARIPAATHATVTLPTPLGRSWNAGAVWESVPCQRRRAWTPPPTLHDTQPAPRQ